MVALVRKELREAWLFAALTLGLYAIYLCKLTGKASVLLGHFAWWMPGINVEVPDVPFVQGNFTSILFFIGTALAIALGFRQSAWEPFHGTAIYLLSLSLTRATIYLTKLFTGIVLLLACTLLPILIYGAWAALPGTHAGPFDWSMTWPAFLVWLLVPLFYLGAFASGIRPARWYGSRLLPLLSVGIAAWILAISSPWPVIAGPLYLLVAIVLVSDILWEAATRDY